MATGSHHTGIRKFLPDLYNSVILLLVPAALHFLGTVGFLLYTAVFGGSTIILDWYISPTTQQNLDRLEKNGYPQRIMWLMMAFNLFISNTLVAVVCEYFQLFDSTVTQWTWMVVPRIITNMILGEITFTAGHYWLHRTTMGAKLHHLHHLCKYSSWSTNFLFHPLDLAVELFGPILSVVVAHIFSQDVLALGISIHVISLWYALDHSENLRLYHYKHHQFVDSNYCITFVEKYLDLTQ